jgi:hypothetical protein
MKKFNEHMLRKTAATEGLAGGLAEAAGQGAAALIPYIVMAPMAAGSAVGYVASKLSSPSDSDVKALQASVIDDEVREKLALSKRRLEALRRRMEEDEENLEAEYGRRDMFV